MAYDADLADRIRERLQDAEVSAVTERQMFGGLGFMVGGNMAVAAGHQAAMMVRCDPAETDELIATPGVSRMEMRGKELDGWLQVAAEALASDADLARWVDVGVDYARSLPTK